MGRAILAATVLIVSVGLAQAGTRADLSGDAVVDFATTMDMPLMAVRNLGNAADMRYNLDERPEGFGQVNYAYNIGKFEVTTGQYTEFLNAVAATDTYGLYGTAMWSATKPCKIERSGAAGSYTYSVAADWADRPVNYVTWGDAARFANWLTNGMPSGAQDLTTTEDGSYFLDGATTDAELMAVTRKSTGDWGQYVIPSEDEWYKAAYHKNDPGAPGGNYFNYPVSSDMVPSNYLGDPDPGNNANYDIIGTHDYYRTEVGEFENSESPYETFDMGGNVGEWTEAISYGSYRTFRGGSFPAYSEFLRASFRTHHEPTGEGYGWGFRVAEVPEPASAALMLVVGGFVVRRKGRPVA